MFRLNSQSSMFMNDNIDFWTDRIKSINIFRSEIDDVGESKWLRSEFLISLIEKIEKFGMSLEKMFVEDRCDFFAIFF